MICLRFVSCMSRACKVISWWGKTTPRRAVFARPSALSWVCGNIRIPRCHRSQFKGLHLTSSMVSPSPISRVHLFHVLHVSPVLPPCLSVSLGLSAFFLLCAMTMITMSSTMLNRLHLLLCVSVLWSFFERVTCTDAPPTFASPWGSARAALRRRI